MNRLLGYWIRLLLVGQTAFLILALRDPGFADQYEGFLIFFVLLPSGAALILGLYEAFRPAQTPLHARWRAGVIGLTPFASLIFLALLASFPFLIQLLGTLVFTSVFLLALRIAVNQVSRFSKFPVAPLLLGLFCFLNLAIVLLSPRAGPRSSGSIPTLLFCADGADWRVIDDMVGAGDLPHVAAAIRDGCRGDLIADEPLFSPILWTTIATGRKPAEHGLWARINDLNASAIRCRRIWDIVESKARSSGAVQFLGLWPLGKAPSAFAVPSIWEGGLGSRPEGYDFIAAFMHTRSRGLTPGDLARFGLDCGRRGMRLSTATWFLDELWKTLMTERPYRGKCVSFMTTLLMERLYVDVFCSLYRKRPTDLAIYYFAGTDKIGHLFWRAYQPERFPNVPEAERKTCGSFVAETYREMDRALGRCLRSMGPEVRVLIVSDHGMEAITDRLGDHGGRVYARKGEFPRWLGFEKGVEWIQGAEKIYLVPEPHSGISYEEIMTRASQACIISTGSPIWEVGFRDPHGDYFAAPLNPKTEGFVELTFRVPPSYADSVGISLPSGLHQLGELCEPAEQSLVSGVHRPQGIFLAYGPGIRSGELIPDLIQPDVMPTILTMMHLPLAQDLPGSPAHVFCRDFLMTQPATVPTYEEPVWEPLEPVSQPEREKHKRSIREQLKALGYIN